MMTAANILGLRHRSPHPGAYMLHSHEHDQQVKRPPPTYETHCDTSSSLSRTPKAMWYDPSIIAKLPILITLFTPSRATSAGSTASVETSLSRQLSFHLRRVAKDRECTVPSRAGNNHSVLQSLHKTAWNAWRLPHLWDGGELQICVF